MRHKLKYISQSQLLTSTTVISIPLLQMCIPLILQNKLAAAEAFVSGHKDLEQELVVLLDSWCHPNFSVEHVTRYSACANILKPLGCVCICMNM